MYHANYNTAGYLSDSDGYDTDDAYMAGMFLAETMTENGHLTIDQIEPTAQRVALLLLSGKRAVAQVSGVEYFADSVK